MAKSTFLKSEPGKKLMRIIKLLRQLHEREMEEQRPFIQQEFEELKRVRMRAMVLKEQYDSIVEKEEWPFEDHQHEYTPNTAVKRMLEEYQEKHFLGG